MSTSPTALMSAVTALADQPAPVVLGSLVLSGAEAPSRITIGGRQLAVIHKLPGGARIIDAMGPDDGAVVWQGVFVGPAAASRVRMVDALRRAGEACTLAFGDYLFEVIVVDFRYSYEARGAIISYSIRAEKIETVVTTGTATALEGAISDCAMAAQFLTNTQASVAAYGGLTGGVSGGASSLLSSVLSVVGVSGTGLSAGDAAAAQSQSLLQSTAAMQAAIPALSVGSLDGSARAFNVTSGTGLLSVVQNAGALAGVVGAGAFINRASVSLAAADAQVATIGVHS